MVVNPEPRQRLQTRSCDLTLRSRIPERSVTQEQCFQAPKLSSRLGCDSRQRFPRKMWSLFEGVYFIEMLFLNWGGRILVKLSGLYNTWNVSASLLNILLFISEKLVIWGG